MEKLISVLESVVEKDVDWANETGLFTKGVIDSIDMAEIISELEDIYDIEITMEYIVPDNFDSVTAMYNMIEELR